MNFKKSVLLVALCAALLSGYTAVTAARQRELSDSVVRLHIRAASDSEEDQALKEAVRDRLIGELFSGELPESRARALEFIEENIGEVERLARDELSSRGCGYDVKAYIARESFDTCFYEDFTLPAGEYTALRVDIGGGGGKNWFCVMYPPVCLPAAGLSAGQAFGGFRIVTREPQKIRVRLKLLEWIADIRRALA